MYADDLSIQLPVQSYWRSGLYCIDLLDFDDNELSIRTAARG